jgi:hypothetical protein
VKILGRTVYEDQKISNQRVCRKIFWKGLFRLDYKGLHRKDYVAEAT